ncbi:carboxymuconolactone decarboxylase family protein [soil metagenome]
MALHHDHGFADLDESTASSPARAILASTREELGMLPSVVARMAVSPPLYHAFRAGIASFAETSLTEAERETVILVLARDIGCDVCITMHRGILTRAGAGDVAQAVLACEPLTDPRLEALAAFTADLWSTRGDVSPAPWEAFLAAGFTRAQALEVVVGVGAYVLSTFANRLTGGTLRPAVSAHREATR